MSSWRTYWRSTNQPKSLLEAQELQLRMSSRRTCCSSIRQPMLQLGELVLESRMSSRRTCLRSTHQPKLLLEDLVLESRMSSSRTWCSSTNLYLLNSLSLLFHYHLSTMSLYFRLQKSNPALQTYNTLVVPLMAELIFYHFLSLPGNILSNLYLVEQFGLFHNLTNALYHSLNTIVLEDYYQVFHNL